MDLPTIITIVCLVVIVVTMMLLTAVAFATTAQAERKRRREIADGQELHARVELLRLMAAADKVVLAKAAERRGAVG